MVNSIIKEFFESNGKLTINGSNAPLLLDGTGNIWFIKSGRVDVFSVAVENNEPKGARGFLFSLKEGDILIGMDIRGANSDRGFLAVGNTDTRLYKTSVETLSEIMEKPGIRDELARMIDNWILGISGGGARYSDLRTDLSLPRSGSVEIMGNRKFKARSGVRWINITSGSVTLLDSDIVDFEGKRYFPITNNSWLMSLKTFETRVITTSELLQEADWRESLCFYHNQALILEELNIRMLLVDDFVRNKEKTETLKQINREAYNNIAEILDESGSEEAEFKSKDPLLAACRILGNELGIKIVEPGPDKNRTAIELKDIAFASKFGIRQIALSDGWHNTDSGGMISFTKDNVPVVLLPDFKGRYRIIIPSEKIDSGLTPELAERISDNGWTFYKPFPLKPITPFEFFKFVFSACKKEIYYLLAAGAVGGMLTLVIPIITGVIMDSVIPQSDITKLLGFGLAIVLSAAALIFAQIIRSLSYIRLDTKIDLAVQSALWDRLVNLPISFFKKYSSGALAAKAGSIGALKQILSFTVINTVVYNVFMAFNLFLLFFYAPVLGLISLIMFSAYLITVFYTGLKIKRKNFTVIQLENQLTSLVNQLLNSITKIKIAGVENLAFKLWTDKYSQKQKKNLAIRKSSNLIIALNSVFPALATAFIYYLFTMSEYSGMTVGTLLSFMTAFNVFLISVIQVSAAAITFFMAAPLFNNAKEILETLPEYAGAKENIKELKGEIEISRAYFRYAKEGNYVLSDISLTIKSGEFVAIVGSSGSGKSTLLRLLLGFEEPETGAVFYDRQNIESIDKSSLRRQIGTVMQSSRLFPGNIYSNIAGVANVSVDYVNDVARIVGLDQDLKRMPMGVFTIVVEGISTFSGGQRQKILLAKALLMRPSILFLDEATSALDNEAQKVIADNLSRIQATRVIVAHRLSAIIDADKIIVLEKGRIVEQGNYDELMSADGVFADLVKRQISESV
jgi:ATP-binding cassette subfamily C protein